MSRSSVSPVGVVERAAELPAGVGRHLRDLLLVLADNKRLLGIRYSDCMLGSPSLETGIASSSMAQDEWGHGRLTYALLSDFGENPKHLEHERGSGEYASIEYLDAPLPGWTGMISAALLLDTALTVQYEALAGSAYGPIRHRVQKLLEEEVIHFQYAAGWASRLGRTPLAAEFGDSLRTLLPACLHWFGPPGWPVAAELERHGLCGGDPDALRGRFLERIWPPLGQTPLAAEVGLTHDGTRVVCSSELDWDGWDERRRRSREGGPDEETLQRVRGDRNRAMLLE